MMEPSPDSTIWLAPDIPEDPKRKKVDDASEQHEQDVRKNSDIIAQSSEAEGGHYVIVEGTKSETKGKSRKTSDVENGQISFQNYNPMSRYNILVECSLEREDVNDITGKLSEELLEHRGLYYIVQEELSRYEVSVCREAAFCTAWIQAFTYTKEGKLVNYFYFQRSSGCHYTARLLFNRLHRALNHIAFTSESSQSFVSPFPAPEQKVSHFHDMLEVLYKQLTYSSGGLKGSSVQPLEKVAEEALIAMVELCNEELFCKLLLQENKILEIVINIAINHDVYVRYYCCMILFKMLTLLGGDAAQALKLSNQMEDLVEVLIEECAVGKYYEVHTRVAAGNLLSKIVSLEICPHAMEIFFKKLYDLEILLYEGSRPACEEKQIGDCYMSFKEVRNYIRDNEL